MTQAYPLQWPVTRKRTAVRRDAAFNKKVHNGSYNQSQSLTVSDAIGRLQREVDLLGAKDYVLSTNLAVRLDGLPRSGQGEPADPGVALYFTLKDKPHCLPCDTYKRVADNIAAIAKHIEATRAIERYGVASIAEMFTGFAALPPPGAKRPWREVLELTGRHHIGVEDIESRFKSFAMQRHPDMPGGSHEAMAELNQAKADALREIGGAS